MKSWKTTLFGALAAVCASLAPVFKDQAEILTAVAGVFTALAFYFAKDKDKTGKG